MGSDSITLAVHESGLGANAADVVQQDWSGALAKASLSNSHGTCTIAAETSTNKEHH